MRWRSQLAAVVLLLGVVSTDGATANSHMRAHFVDVGQGDATLLEFPCGAALIDVGAQNPAGTARLRRYLTEFFGRRTDLNQTIDVVFVTHTHIDHNRALRPLVGDFTVERYVHNGILEGSGRQAAGWISREGEGLGVELRSIDDAEVTASPGGLTDDTVDPLECPNIDPEIRVLSGRIRENPGWSSEGWDDGRGNNQSLVIRVDFGELSFLFTGDLEEEGIETLVEYYDGSGLLDVDVYQVGHHGSHNGTTESLMEAMTPVAAVISMGRWNDRQQWTAWQYGHPRAHAVDLVAEGVSRRVGARQVYVAERVKRFTRRTLRRAVYGTGWDGDVVIFGRSDGQMRIYRGRR